MWAHYVLHLKLIQCMPVKLQLRKNREFPGSPVVRTQRFHCWVRVQSLVGELRSHKLCGMAKKEKKQKQK